MNICMGKDAFVLCRIFEKSGSGPKNGEQYGAPFIEEEWEEEDDEVTGLPKQEVLADEMVLSDGSQLDKNDLRQVCQIMHFLLPPSLGLYLFIYELNAVKK